MIDTAVLLVALPLFTKKTLAQPKPVGTLRIALARLTEEGFFCDMGGSIQSRVFLPVSDLSNQKQSI
jgi:hypothetical protein